MVVGTTRSWWGWGRGPECPSDQYLIVQKQTNKPTNKQTCLESVFAAGANPEATEKRPLCPLWHHLNTAGCKYGWYGWLSIRLAYGWHTAGSIEIIWFIFYLPAGVAPTSSGTRLCNSKSRRRSSKACPCLSFCAPTCGPDVS